MKILGKLIINVFALAVVDYLIPGFDFDSFYALVVTAVVMGIINTFIKPVLQLVALPITLITFGVGAFVINVLLLWLTSYLVPGFTILNFFTAAIASIVLTLVSWFLHRLEKN